MNVDALNAFLEAQFTGLDPLPVVELADDDVTRLRLPYHPRWLRPGGTLSGPAMMTLADTVAYVALLSRTSAAQGAVTVHMDIHFLRRPQPTDLVASGTVRKLGRRLAVVAVTVESEGQAVADATVTYAMPTSQSD